MRILFTRFPLESAYGGAEIQTVSLMEGLLKKGHAVAFVGSCPTLLKLCAERNIPHAELQIGKPPVTKQDVLSFVWRKQRMQKLLRETFNKIEGIGAIVMLSLSEKLLLTEHALKKGSRISWLEHDRIGPWLTKNPWLPQLRTLSAQVTTIAVSELSRKLYLDLGWPERRVVAIPNGIDLERFAPISRPLPPLGEEEMRQHWIKKPMNRTVLHHAREMRKEPTQAEEILWKHLRFDRLGVRFRRQHPMGGRIIDFYCHEAQLGIELDGDIHLQSDQQNLDSIREAELAEQDVRLLRFTNEEVLADPLQTVAVIQKELQHSPPLVGEGPGVGEEKRKGKHLLHVGCVARLSQEKGISILVEAAQHLPIRLSIVGKGPEEQHIRQLLQSIDPRGERTELLTETDLGVFYRSLDAFVLPSRDHDPFGLTAAEAMAVGVPVVVTDACGIAGYLRHGEDALIAKADNVASLAQELGRLLDASARERIARAGQKTAREKFALETMVNAYETLLTGSD